MSSRETEMSLTFPQMVLLLNLVKPGLQMVESIKSHSLYSADPNLELSISKVRAQNHHFTTDLFEFIRVSKLALDLEPHPSLC